MENWIKGILWETRNFNGNSKLARLLSVIAWDLTENFFFNLIVWIHKTIWKEKWLGCSCTNFTFLYGSGIQDGQLCRIKFKTGHTLYVIFVLKISTTDEFESNLIWNISSMDLFLVLNVVQKLKMASIAVKGLAGLNEQICLKTNVSFSQKP